MFIKTSVSVGPTLQNIEVEIANAKNSNYKIINAIIVPLICIPISEQCVSAAKNQYDHLKYLKARMHCEIFLTENFKKYISGVYHET